MTHPRLGSVSVCLGNGDASFAACQDLGPVGKNPRGLASADFNRDGTLDLAVAATGDGTIVVLDGLGNGHFAAPRKVGRAGHPFMLTTADLNRDEIADLAVAEEDSGLVTLLGEGRGGFKKQAYKTGKWSSDVAAADFNEDAMLDLAVTNWGSNDVSILLGQGGGKFGPARNITYEGNFWDHHALYRVLATDLDRDGHVDMVWNDIIKQALYVVYGDGSGGFPRHASFPAGRGVRYADAGDLDGDGWLDLVSTNTADDDVSVLLGDARGGFSRVQRVRVGRLPRMGIICDVNGDSRPDVVVTSMKDEAVTVLVNQGVTDAAAVEEPPQRKILDTLREPSAVLIAPDGRLLVADEGNHRVVSIDVATGAVTAIAGTGYKGYGGDGKLATDALLYRPAGLAADADGNLYVADSGNHRVRKIDARGIITTIAGTGAPGFGGDGGPALSAALDRPSGLAIGANRTLYIADAGNRRVRVLDASGTITTVAGFDGESGAGGVEPGAHSEARDVTSVALDVDGALLVVDRLHHRVFKRNRAGSISAVAGNGTPGNAGDGGPAAQAELAYPSAIATMADGTFLVSDSGNNAIRAIGADGKIRTVATSSNASGLGAAAKGEGATPWEPSGVAADAAGNVYFTDRRNHCVRRIDAAGKIRLVAGKESLAGRTHEANVTAESLPLLPPSQATPPIDLTWEYVLESGSDDNSIYAITAGEPDVVYVGGDVGSGADWRIQQLVAGKPGWRFDLAGPGVDMPLALTRTPDGTLVATGIEDDADGDRDALVVAVGPDGRERWRQTEAKPGEQTCRGIAADTAGNLYLACESEHRWEIVSFDHTGKLRWKHDDGTVGSAHAIAVDAQGGIFVAGEEPEGWRAVKLSSDGTLVWQHRVPGRAAAHGIAATGDGGAIVVGSRTSGRLNLRAERLRADGTVAWEYEASSPAGAVVARAVALDQNGQPIVAGEIGSDWLVLALDDTGKRRWHFTHDGGGGLKNRDQAFAVAFAPPDHILVAGRVHRLPLIPPSLGQIEWRAASYRRREAAP